MITTEQKAELTVINRLIETLRLQRQKLLEGTEFSFYDRESLKAYIQGDVKQVDGIWGV